MMTSQSKKQAFPELRGKLSQIRYPAYIEPKIDGELNRYIPTLFLANKSGKLRGVFPVIIELAGMHIEYDLLGELYWGDGKAGALYEFLKRQDSDNLQYMVFDVDMPGTYRQRRAWLEQNIKPTQHVALVGSFVMANEQDVRRGFRWWTREGFEGIVVKNADSRLIMGPCNWVKMKKKDESIYTISFIDPSHERICVFVPVAGPKTSYVRDVGVKVCNKDKKGLKVGNKVKIEHQGILSSGGLRHPVFKGKV